MKKLTIQPYDKPDSKGVGKESKGSAYEVLINPATLSVSKIIKRSTGPAPIGKSKASKFSAYEQDSLKFEIVLDGTGMVGNTDDVYKQVDELESVVYSFQTQYHQAYFLEISWGSMFFRGYLTSIDINYTLFDADGNALRAKVNLAFTGYLPPEKLEQASPDMTHVRFVKQGDTLAGFCHDIYGSSRFVIHVAEYNNLMGFRSLSPGQRLEFPPLINASHG